MTSRDPGQERRRSRIVAEGVRQAIWQMQGSDDLKGLLTAIGDSLDRIGIPFLYCGVNVVDTSGPEPRVTAHSLRHDSQWFHLEGRGAETVLDFWRGGRTVYRRCLSQDDPYGEFERFRNVVESVVDIPFTHGTLAVSSREPAAFTDGDLDVLANVATWLSDGFRRLEDLRALEARNAELEREVAERRRAEEQLAESLEEKIVLLREIHHRVKNNLQVVSSLLSLQSFYTEEEVAKAGFRESRARIESMALIHEQLHESKDLAIVDGGEYLRCLAGHLFSTYGIDHEVIDLDVQVTSIDMDVDTAIHCGLIVNELVSNSLKYGFPDGRTGCIHVALKVEEDESRAHLQVHDDGVGLQEDGGLTRSSMGLQLVEDLTTQLEGELERHTGTGTGYSVHFPLAAAERPVETIS
jgi:two-component sensor histidine kinase